MKRELVRTKDVLWTTRSNLSNRPTQWANLQLSVVSQGSGYDDGCWKGQWHFALTIALVCVHIQYWLSEGWNSCRVGLQPSSHHPQWDPITNRYRWPSHCPGFCLFLTVAFTVVWSCRHSKTNNSRKTRNVSSTARNLTNFTVSVVFLYGIVLSEANTSHPFNAFWSC